MNSLPKYFFLLNEFFSKKFSKFSKFSMNEIIQKIHSKYLNFYVDFSTKKSLHETPKENKNK